MISRRTFMQQAGAFASAAVLVSCSPSRRRYKMGLQLYTMRAAMARDVEGTLKRVAGMGYEEVETYGFDPEGIRLLRAAGQGVRAAPARPQPHDPERPLRSESVRRRQRRRPEALRRPLHRRRPRARADVHHLAAARRGRPNDREVQGRRRAAERRRRTDQEGRAAARLPQPRLRVRRAERADRLRHHPQGDGSRAGQAADGPVLDRARLEAHRQRVVQAGSPAAS